MTVFIYYTGNKTGLSVIITQLQPQLAESDDIYIVDASPGKKGVTVANQYSSTRCYIFVEVADCSFEIALKYALQSMVENKQEGLLVLSDRCVISSTFISNLKRVAGCDFFCLSPKVYTNPYERLNQNFRWYNPPNNTIEKAPDFDPRCFYIKEATNKDCGLLANELVVYTAQN